MGTRSAFGFCQTLYLNANTFLKHQHPIGNAEALGF
jgi:hypothetical protein